MTADAQDEGAPGSGPELPAGPPAVPVSGVHAGEGAAGSDHAGAGPGPHPGALRLAGGAAKLALALALCAAAAPLALRLASPEAAVAAAFFPHQLTHLEQPVLRLAWPAYDLPTKRDPWGAPFLLGPRRAGRPWPAGPGEASSPAFAEKVYSMGPDGRDDQGEGDDVLVPALLARPHRVDLFGVPLDASARLGLPWGPAWLVAALAFARPALGALAAGVLALAGWLWLAARPRQPARREAALVVALAGVPIALGAATIGLGASWVRSAAAFAPGLQVEPTWAAVGTWALACALFAIAWRRRVARASADDHAPDAGQRGARAALLGLAAAVLLALGVGAGVRAALAPWLLGRPVAAWDGVLRAGASDEAYAAALVLAQADPARDPIASELVPALVVAFGRHDGESQVTRALATALGRAGPRGVAALTSLATARYPGVGVVQGLVEAGDDGRAALPALLPGARGRLAWDRELARLLGRHAAREPAARDLLLEALAAATEPRRRLDLAEALGSSAPVEAARALVDALATAEDPADHLRATDALLAIGPAGAPAAPALAAAGLDGPLPPRRALALLALQGEGFDRGALARAFAEATPEVRAAGLLVVGLLAAPEPALVEAARVALADPAPLVRHQAALALGVHGGAADRAAIGPALVGRVGREVARIAASRRPAR